MGFAVGEGFDVVFRFRPEGGEGGFPFGVRREQRGLPDAGGHQLGIFDNHLVGLFGPQVGKFVQHFLGGFEIQGRLQIGVAVALAGLDDGAEDGVLGIQEMHVAGGHHRQAQFFAQAHDAAVVFPQGLLVGHLAFPDQEGVVAQGLDLQVVVEPGDFGQLFIAGAVHHGAVQFARFAGGAHDDALAVFLQHGPGNVGLAAEILQVRLGNHVVQVSHAVLVGGQQDDVPGIAQGVALGNVVQVLQLFGALLPGVVHHPRQALGGGSGVVDGPVGVLERYAQALAHRSQPVGFQFRIQFPGQRQGVDLGRLVFEAQALQFAFQHGAVELGVVGRDGAAVHKGQQLGQQFGGIGPVPQHLVGDVGDFGDFLRQQHPGVHQLPEGIHHLAVGQLHRADFNDAVLGGVEPGGFKVQHDHRRIQGQVGIARHRFVVVGQVAFHAGDQLDAELLGCAEGFREGLHHPVVGHGDGFVAPFGRPLDQGSGAGYGVHVAHLGVQMQFDALLRGVVHALGQIAGGQVPGHDARFVGKIVVLGVAPHQDAHAGFHGLDHLFHRFPLLVGNGRRILVLPGLGPVAQEDLAPDGAGVIGDQERQQHHFAAAHFLAFSRQHLAPDHHQAAVVPDLPDGNGRIADGLAPDAGVFFDRLFLCLGGQLLVPCGALRRDAVLVLPFLLQRPQALFLVPANAQRHFGVQPENIPDHLGQLLLHVLLFQVMVGKLVGHFQGDAAVAGHPAHVKFPGRRGRVMPDQEIVQRRGVLVRMLQKFPGQGRAGHAQGKFQPRKRLFQRGFHHEKALLPDQHIGKEGKVRLVFAFHIPHPFNGDLALGFGQRLVHGLQQFVIRHS